MGTKGTTKALPRELKRIRERFEAWRRTRTRGRIPERLWAEAAGAAGRYGVNGTARALRLNATTLRQRLPATGSAEQAARPPAPGRAGFVELASLPPAADRAAYVLEVESAGGVRLRLDVRDAGGLDLAALIRSVVGDVR